VSAFGATLFALTVNPWIMVPAAALFGVGSGTALTAIYSVAGSVIPTSAQGAGFGLLTSAALIGVATSPLIAGTLAAWTLRGVFVLDVMLLLLLALFVRRTIVIGARPT
jgi:MFS family permease